MKSLGLVLTVALMSLSTAFAQSDAHKSHAYQSETQKSAAQQPDPQKSSPAPTEAQKSFDTMKSLAGSWEGRPKVTPPVPDVDGKSATVTFRVASRGHTLMHDLKIEGMPDNPITMLVVDAERLLLTHYCDGDNRPRMVGKMSADGKTVEFDYLDISGNLNHGHMHHAVFTFIDANHHIEEWTYMMPGDKPIVVHFDLQRVPAASARLQ